MSQVTDLCDHHHLYEGHCRDRLHYHPHINPPRMHDEEIIDTSDVEENVDASQYWRTAASRARSGYARLWGARSTDGERSPKRLKVRDRNSWERFPTLSILG